VHLSTGASRSYSPDPSFGIPGDKWDFTASFAGYRVDVHVRVVTGPNGRQCEASTSHLTRTGG
jgi:hypothetical protein